MIYLFFFKYTFILSSDAIWFIDFERQTFTLRKKKCNLMMLTH